MTPDQASAIARRIADERGWTWREPIRVTRTRRWIIAGRIRWEVWSNADALGGNVRVIVDDDTGDILMATRLPR